MFSTEHTGLRLIRSILLLTFAACAPHSAGEFRPAWAQAAASGDPQAVYQLAMEYHAHAVQAKDRREYEESQRAFASAAHWFRRAAELGNVNAMVGLAGNLYWGSAGVRDPEEARVWFQKAYEKGERDSSPFYLGELYARGELRTGVDYKKALAFYRAGLAPFSIEALLRVSDPATKIPTLVYGPTLLRRISLFYRCGWGGLPQDVELANRILAQCEKYLASPWCRDDLKNKSLTCDMPVN